jgi:predicted RNA-binding Zn ribbon-like protein
MIYEFLGGNLALDFANTVHNHGMADPGDDLKTVDDLVEWAAQAGLLRGAEARGLRNVSDTTQFRQALALREMLYAIFSSAAKGRKADPHALQTFQIFYQNAVRRTEFQAVGKHYQLAWPADTHPLDRVLQEIARSAADLLTSEAITRVRQCAGKTCSWLFVDSSRNRLRRWCDMKMCGNRAKVRRFRQRSQLR